MYGSATWRISIAVSTRVGTPAFSSASCMREGVDHGREHPHVVALRAVHPRAGALEAAEDVPAADDDADLHAEGVDLGELGGRGADDGAVDAEAPVASRRALRRSA